MQGRRHRVSSAMIGRSWHGKTQKKKKHRHCSTMAVEQRTKPKTKNQKGGHGDAEVEATNLLPAHTEEGAKKLWEKEKQLRKMGRRKPTRGKGKSSTPHLHRNLTYLHAPNAEVEKRSSRGWAETTRRLRNKRVNAYIDVGQELLSGGQRVDGMKRKREFRKTGATAVGGKDA